MPRRFNRRALLPLAAHAPKGLQLNDLPPPAEAWCQVPTGPFFMGCHKGLDKECVSSGGLVPRGTSLGARST